MTYIIGDIHGELTKLKQLIRNITEKDPGCVFVFIGDYLDKGEDPYNTLVYLCELSNKYICTFLYGNHEYLWLNLQEGDTQTEAYLLKYGAINTLRSFQAKNIIETREKLLNQFGVFFSSLKPFWKNDQYVAVHSGISPEDYNTLLEEIPLKKLLFNRYDFIKQKQLYLDRYKVIFGHTGFYRPYIDKYKLGVDTAACFTEQQPLTAFCTRLEQFIDSDNNRYLMSELPLDRCPNIPRIKPWRML